MRFLLGISAFTLVLALLFSGCIHFPAQNADVFRNQSYGPHQRNKLDIFLPEHRDSTTTTVVLVHGGAWVAGDKGGGELRDIRNILLESGYAVASINYRYACEDFMKQMEDIAGALDLLRNNAEDWRINDSRFALMGFSAGGHLALLYTHAFDTADVVKTVVSVVGPTDLTDSLFQAYATNYNLWWTVEKLVGTTLIEDATAYQNASPLYNWSNKPTLLVYGAQDDLVPAQQGIALFDTLVSHQIPTDTVVPELGTHNVHGPNNQYKVYVETEVLSWLETFLP